jgi:hypothetical protein
MPLACLMSSSRLRIWPRIETSAPDNGSSATMRRGCGASARAMAIWAQPTRAWPPHTNPRGERVPATIGEKPAYARSRLDQCCKQTSTSVLSLFDHHARHVCLCPAGSRVTPRSEAKGPSE